MKQGYVKAHRSWLEDPVIWKDADHIAVWMYLVMNATHASMPVMFAGKQIDLKPGQLITGRKKISVNTKINESKVQRIISLLKSSQHIEQQTSNKNSLITILSWDVEQRSDQQNDQQVINRRTTSEQQVNTNNNVINNVFNNGKRPAAPKKNKFNNFEQRDYNYEELEKQLLSAQM